MPTRKYLMAAVLVALCAALTAGAALAQHAWDVTVEEWVDEDGEDRETVLEDFPAGLVWEQSAAVSVTVENTGTIDWDANYDLRSTDGPTTVVINRWGLRYAPEDGLTPPVVAGADPPNQVTVDFTITAPPITSVSYDPADLTAPVADPLGCYWRLAAGGSVIDPIYTVPAPDPVPDESKMVGLDIATGTFSDLLPRIEVDQEEDEDGEEHDVRTLVPGSWAFAAVEECAGRAPTLIRGYPDGTYQPAILVTRDQMAVYIRRGMKIPKLYPASAVWIDDPDEEDPAIGEWETYNTFPDVPYNEFLDPPDVHWAIGDIEALLMDDDEDEGYVGPGAEVVQGYADGLYHPNWEVTRGQMAVFIFRAKRYEAPPDDEEGNPYAIQQRYEAFMEWYEDPDAVPPPPEPAGLLDMPLGFWCDGEVYACVDNDVVKGYADYRYRPAVFVTREQMAVYMYRAFIQPTDAAVVLAGPDVGNTDPTTLEYHGIQGESLDPTLAYVGFDAARMGTSLAVGGTWQVEFKFLEGEGPTLAGMVTVNVPESDITDANAAVAATGDPYFYVVTPIPTLATEGGGLHTMVVSVEDTNGLMNELPRRVGLFLTGAAPPPAGCPIPPDADDPSVHPDSWVDSSSRACMSGFLADMAEDDEMYYATGITPGVYPCPGDSWTYGEGETFVWHDVPADAMRLRVTLDYHVKPFDLDAGNAYTACCGSAPGCSMWGSPEPGATDPPYGWGLSMCYWADWWTGAGWGHEADIQAASAPFGQYYGNPVMVDRTHVWETTNVADYRNGDGDVAITWCGICSANLYVDKCTLEYVVPPEPRIPDADDPSVHPDWWVDSSSRACMSGYLADMAEDDGMYYVTGITPGVYPCPGDSWTYGEGETFVWHDIPADALDLTLVLDYHVKPFDLDAGNAYTACCGSAPGCSMWGSPEPGATDPPYGWGLSMCYWADWWTGAGWGHEADIQAADAPFGQYYGNPVMIDRTHTWTTTNVSDYVNGSGDVAITWCGICSANLYVDQCVLSYTPNPATAQFPADTGACD